ncbi:Uncharacterised protein [Actinomyces bovis]|uniref:ABC transporter permease n=1 Tax=Actinomyces bovis TaxID=1658 RepID=A0ABY1VKK2_9ACTO|nr:DUF6297 family protein [Actinomyces bovis]SPT52639.1 Uncharacterised protein [Actinomyces bovis]VEG54521.1 Uncharacterised protein [Actinomyces israelii]
MSGLSRAAATSQHPPHFGAAVSLEEVRQWTRRTQLRRRRLSRTVSEDLTDIYTALLAALVAAAIVIPRLSSATAGTQDSAPAAWKLGFSPDPLWLTAAAFLVIAAGSCGALRRLGPLFLRLEQTVWWLPLPGARRNLLAATALRLGLLLCALAVAASVVTAMALSGGWAMAVSLSLLSTGTVFLVVLQLVTAQAQGRAHGQGTVRIRLGLVATATICLLCAVAGPHAWWSAYCLGGVGLLALLAASIAWRYVMERAEQVDDGSLLAASRQAFSLRVAGLALDSREIGRVLAPRLKAPSRPAGMGLSRLAVPLPTALRCTLGVAQADWLLLRRQPWRLAATGGSAVLATALPWVALRPLWWLLAWLLLCWLTVLVLADPARRACFDPGVDELWPTSPVWVRLGHMLIPAAFLMPWHLLVGLSFWSAVPAPKAKALDLLVLLLAAGIGWGAVAVRSGMRAPADWSIIIPTPFGVVSQGTIDSLLAGPDAAIVIALPTLMLLLGVQVPWMPIIQVVASLGILLLVLRQARS